MHNEPFEISELEEKLLTFKISLGIDQPMSLTNQQKQV